MNDLLYRVENIVFKCIGDDGLREYPDYLDVDFFEEYYLDEYDGVEILVCIRQELGIALMPSKIERHEMNTIKKIYSLVERCQ